MNKMRDKLLFIAFVVAIASSFGFCQADAGKFNMNFGMLLQSTHNPPSGSAPKINLHLQLKDLSYVKVKNPPRPPGSQGSPGKINPHPPPSDLSYVTVKYPPRSPGSLGSPGKVNPHPPSRDLSYVKVNYPPKPPGSQGSPGKVNPHPPASHLKNLPILPFGLHIGD